MAIKLDPELDFEAELEQWARAHEQAGMVQAKQVIRLIRHCKGLRMELMRIREFNEALADRCHKQSELLSSKAEKNTVGTLENLT